MSAPQSFGAPPDNVVEHTAREVLFRAQQQSPTPKCHVNIVQCVIGDTGKDIPFRSMDVPTSEFVSEIPWGRTVRIMEPTKAFPALRLNTEAIPGFRDALVGKRADVFAAVVDVHEKDRVGALKHRNTFQLVVPWEEARKQIASLDKTP